MIEINSSKIKNSKLTYTCREQQNLFSMVELLKVLFWIIIIIIILYTYIYIYIQNIYYIYIIIL